MPLLNISKVMKTVLLEAKIIVLESTIIKVKQFMEMKENIPFSGLCGLLEYYSYSGLLARNEILKDIKGRARQMKVINENYAYWIKPYTNTYLDYSEHNNGKLVFKRPYLALEWYVTRLIVMESVLKSYYKKKAKYEKEVS